MFEKKRQQRKDRCQALMDEVTHIHQVIDGSLGLIEIGRFNGIRQKLEDAAYQEERGNYWFAGCVYTGFLTEVAKYMVAYRAKANQMQQQVR
jgi:hypothetical protein